MTEKAKQTIKFIMKNSNFDQQLEQAEEEASEFILAAQKWKRYGTQEWYGNLTEETGDLMICMEVMRRYIGCPLVDRVIAEKLERQERRILEGEIAYEHK